MRPSASRFEDLAASIAAGVASMRDAGGFRLKETNLILVGTLTWERELVFSQIDRVRGALYGRNAPFTTAMTIAIEAVEEPHDGS